MPLYRCTTPAGTLDDERRQAIARAITTIHCDVTGAPPTFVHVQFFDGPEDPKLILIAFDPREAETWTGPGRLVTGLKLAFTAITGKRTSIGEQRTVPM